MTGKGGGVIAIGKNGIVESDNVAILSRGDNQEIINKGLVEGNNGIISFGRNVDIVNDGTIDGPNSAIRISQGSGHIVNNGKLFGEGGVYIEGTAGSGKFTVVNNGLIQTDKTGIDLQGDGNYQIVNRGKIDTDVGGGAGNDRYVNDGGRVTGVVNLHDGNDTYIIDRTSIVVDEASYGGKDQVKASVDFTIGAGIEKLILTGTGNIDGTGNSEANRLIGNSGKNRLDGWGGDDLLKGAGGRDVFVFSYHGGSDEILDFKSGTDRIDMRGWVTYGFDSFKDVKSNATQMGDDLLISDGGTDDLLIHNFDKADLAKADFIF